VGKEQLQVMKFALAGIGKWGKNYIKTFQNMTGHELVATHSRTRESYDNLPPEIDKKNLFWFNNLDSMLRLDFDTLIVATPPDTHYEIAHAGLMAHKHVICEKPCMFNEAQFSRIEQFGTCFYTNYINQYAYKVPEMQESIGNNAFSTLSLVNVGAGPFRANYNSLWDYGVHEIFMAMYLNNTTKVKVRNYDKQGERHFLTLDFPRSRANITVGAGFPERINSKVCSNADGITSWFDYKTEPLLQKMIDSFGKFPTSNLPYSRAIAEIMKHL
jgi:predicted dehydrogenase